MADCSSFLKIKKTRTVKIPLLLLLCALILVVSMVAQASSVTVDRFTLESPDLPKEFDGYKIIYISDIHHGLYLNSHSLADLVQYLSAEDPDCILLGGDYIRYDGSDFPDVIRGLTGLRAKDGVYGVMGNHDIRWAGATPTQAFFDSLGILNIENTNIRITKNGKSIVLSGAQDAIYGRPDAEKALSGVQTNDFNIFVTHNPLLFANGWNSNYNNRIDLALTGHTHGGQISLFGLWSPMGDGLADLYRPTLRERDGLKYIISNGYGTTFLPIRFFVPPQIHVITLRAQG